MKSKLTVALVFSVLALIVFLVFELFNEADALAKESSQRALFEEIQVQLEEYKTETGSYPDSLSSLRFTFPDGGSPELLTDIAYEFTSNEYTLKTIGYASDQVIEHKSDSDGHDLSKVGDKTIPLTAITVEPNVGMTSPSINNGKEFKLGTKASLTLKKIYKAQRVYFSEHPTESVSSLTAPKLIPYLPDHLTSLPTAQSLDGSILNIKVSVSPPVFIDENGLDYDPSGNNVDGLWDVGP